MTDISMIIKELENMGIEARATEVNKNGIIKTGVVVGSGNVRPTIYVDNMEGTPEEIARQVAKLAEDASPVDFGDVKSLITRENILSTVKAKVVPFFTSYLDGKVYRRFLDLAICYYIPVSNDGTITITEQLLKDTGIDENELYEKAMSHNMAKIQDMADMMAELMGMPEDVAALMGGIPRGQQIVITNMDNKLGAIALAGNLDEACELLDTDDIYIMPSSVHELIAVNGNMNVESLREMVSEVNDTQVAPEERLSYNVYAYKRGGEIAIA